MNNSRIEVLLIEDDLAEADLMREMLAESRKWEFSVEHVHYLADGLNLLKSRGFDCVLVDLCLPDSQWLETALAVRDQTKLTPIAIVTILDDEELALKALQMDMQDYLIKGEITGNLLVRSIRYAIQRKRSSEDLRESGERFAAFMLNLPAAAWMKDMQGRYAYANAEAERVFPMPLTALLGKTDRDLFPPETARQFGENDCRVFSEGGSLQTTEVLRQADGIDHHFIVNKFAVNGRDGKPAYVAGIAFDITERKRVEAEMETLASYPLMNPNPILEMDTAGRLTFCNSAAKEILEKAGYGDESNPFIPEDLPAVFKSLLDGKAPSVFREVKVDGKYFEELIFLAPHLKTARFYTMDITRRKQAELERERLLLQLEAILNSINEGVVVSDLEGRVSIMNREALALHEIERIEEVRRSLSEYQETFELFDHEGRPVPFEEWPLTRALRGERFVDYEVRVHRRDTGRVWIASYCGSPVQNSAGENILAVTTVRDVTERKRMEDELKKNEERFRALVTASSEVLYRMSPDWSEMRQLYSHKLLASTESPSRTWLQKYIHPDDQPHVTAVIREAISSKSVFELEHRILRADGSLGWTFSRAVPLMDANGEIVEWFGVASDITERKTAEEEINRLNTDLAARAFELEIANRELDTFNYTVAHDLRKPLAVVNGYCQALRELCGDKLDEACNDYLREAYEGTLRMNWLINALLNFSRLAHVEPLRESVDLSAMAHVVSSELKLAEPERRVEFQIADGISADGDATLLRVVLDNLLGNAWKYTGTRGEAVIEFGVTEIDGHPACFVRDNGAGFDMDYAEKLFMPFQRLPGAEECKGFGIGLATVERIIRRHGGKIWAAGEPGKGATFWFTLQS